MGTITDLFRNKVFLQRQSDLKLDVIAWEEYSPSREKIHDALDSLLDQQERMLTHQSAEKIAKNLTKRLRAILGEMLPEGDRPNLTDRFMDELQIAIINDVNVCREIYDKQGPHFQKLMKTKIYITVAYELALQLPAQDIPEWALIQCNYDNDN